MPRLYATIDTFESGAPLALRGWDAAPELVLNPLIDETNLSSTVVRWQRAEGRYRGGLYVMTPDFFDFSEDFICQIRVWSPRAGPVLFRAVNRGESIIEDRWCTIDQANTWVTLRVSFLGLPPESLFWVGIMPWPEETEPALLYFDDFGFTRPDQTARKASRPATENARPQSLDVRQGQLVEPTGHALFLRGVQVVVSNQKGESVLNAEESIRRLARYGTNHIALTVSPETRSHEVRRLLKAAEGLGMAVSLRASGSIDDQTAFWDSASQRSVAAACTGFLLPTITWTPQMSPDPAYRRLMESVRTLTPTGIIALEVSLEDAPKAMLPTGPEQPRMLLCRSSAGDNLRTVDALLTSTPPSSIALGLLFDLERPLSPEECGQWLAYARAKGIAVIGPLASGRGDRAIAPEGDTQALTGIGHRFLLGRHGVLETSKRMAAFDTATHRSPVMRGIIPNAMLVPGIQSLMNWVDLREIFSGALRFAIDDISRPDLIRPEIDARGRLHLHMISTSGTGTCQITVRAMEWDNYWDPFSAVTTFQVQVTANSAFHASVSASSIADESHAADAAVDGSNSTYWGSAAGPEQEFRLDLRAERDVARVLIYWDPCQEYRIELSADGREWTAVAARKVDPASAGHGHRLTASDHSFDTKRARYLRIHMRGPSYPPGFGIREVEVYADGAGPMPGLDWVTLRHRASGMVVSANPATPGHITLEPNQNTPWQQWTIVPKDGGYALFNRSGGGSLELQGVPDTASMRVVQTTFLGRGQQLWEVAPATDSPGVIIRSVQSHQTLSAALNNAQSGMPGRPEFDIIPRTD